MGSENPDPTLELPRLLQKWNSPCQPDHWAIARVLPEKGCKGGLLAPLDHRSRSPVPMCWPAQAPGAHPPEAAPRASNGLTRVPEQPRAGCGGVGGVGRPTPGALHTVVLPGVRLRPAWLLPALPTGSSQELPGLRDQILRSSPASMGPTSDGRWKRSALHGAPTAPFFPNRRAPRQPIRSTHQDQPAS